MQQLRVDTAGLRAIATRWSASVGELNATSSLAGLGLPSHVGAAVVNAGRADVTAFTVALAARVGTRATHVIEADSHFIANEVHSANEMAAVANRVTSV